MMTEQQYSLICQKILNGASVRSILPSEKERIEFRRMVKRKNDSIGLVVKKRRIDQLIIAQQARQRQATDLPVGISVPVGQMEHVVSAGQSEGELPLIEVEKKIGEQLTKRSTIGPVTSEALLTRTKELIAIGLETNPNPAWAKLALEICKQELPAWRGDTKSTPADYKLVLDELIAPEPIRLQVLQRKDTKEAI